ncbi:MAG TPA: hypothetical protein VFQ44_04570 [Streptosporangiaceae bacterium]|nr:hypothetical protein [Streptosporangiaceae bacterium]
MSDQRIVNTVNSDSKARWAALDSRNERLVSISDRLLINADHDQGGERELKAVS